MADAVLLERLLAGGAIMLVIAGAAGALIATNAIKRLVGVTIASLGVVVALALWAAQAVAVGVAIMFAQLAVGVALAVRMQESYGSIEVRDVDAADAADDPRDRDL